MTKRKYLKISITYSYTSSLFSLKLTFINYFPGQFIAPLREGWGLIRETFLISKDERKKNYKLRFKLKKR